MRDLEAIAFRDVLAGGEYLQVVLDVQPANRFALQRDDVVDVRANASPVEGGALRVDASNGGLVRPCGRPVNFGSPPPSAKHNALGVMACAKGRRLAMKTAGRIGKVSKGQTAPANGAPMILFAFSTGAHQPTPRSSDRLAQSKNARKNGLATWH